MKSLISGTGVRHNDIKCISKILNRRGIKFGSNLGKFVFHYEDILNENLNSCISSLEIN